MIVLEIRTLGCIFNEKFIPLEFYVLYSASCHFWWSLFILWAKYLDSKLKYFHWHIFQNRHSLREKRYISWGATGDMHGIMPQVSCCGFFYLKSDEYLFIDDAPYWTYGFISWKLHRQHGVVQRLNVFVMKPWHREK